MSASLKPSLASALDDPMAAVREELAAANHFDENAARLESEICREIAAVLATKSIFRV